MNFFLNSKINLFYFSSRLRKAYTKISKFSDVLAYFALKQWKFYNKNTQNLFSELCEADKKLFDFDMSKLDWNDYFYSYVRGIRVYLLKDPLDTVPKSITKHRRLKYVHYFCCTLLSLGVLRLLWGVLSFMFSLVF